MHIRISMTIHDNHEAIYSTKEGLALCCWPFVAQMNSWSSDQDTVHWSFGYQNYPHVGFNPKVYQATEPHRVSKLSETAAGRYVWTPHAAPMAGIFLQTWPDFIAKHGEVKHNGVCIETAKKIGVLQPLVTRTSCNENCLIFWEKNTQRKGQDTQGFPPTGAFRRLMALFCKGPVWIKPGTGSGCRGSLY